MPNPKLKGERTGLVVMGRDYAGLILENTDKGLVLSQIECKKADKGEAEQVNSSVGLTQNTVYLKVRFSCDGKKLKASEGGNDLIVMCNFSYAIRQPFSGKGGTMDWRQRRHVLYPSGYCYQ